MAKAERVRSYGAFSFNGILSVLHNSEPDRRQDHDKVEAHKRAMVAAYDFMLDYATLDSKEFADKYGEWRSDIATKAKKIFEAAQKTG
jgi:hypothetical protein